MKRAEDAGFKALVLTIDAPFFGIRRDDIRNKFQLPAHLKMANFEGVYFFMTCLCTTNMAVEGKVI